LKKQITSIVVFFASSQALIAFAEDVFNPTKPIGGHTWLRQLSVMVERMFAWL
jgi:hypothetical protein